MNFRLLIFIGMLGTVLLSSCSAPRGLNHSVTKATAPVLGSISSENAHVAKMLANSSGEYLLVSLGGEVFDASVRENYRNALGEDCKRVHLRGKLGTTGTAAICRDEQGTWRYLAPLN